MILVNVKRMSFVIVFMLIGAQFTSSYGYFFLLRWVLFSSSIFLLRKLKMETLGFGWWCFAVTAIVYNPLVQIQLTRNLWFEINFLTAALYVAISDVYSEYSVDTKIKIAIKKTFIVLLVGFVVGLVYTHVVERGNGKVAFYESCIDEVGENESCYNYVTEVGDYADRLWRNIHLYTIAASTFVYCFYKTKEERAIQN